MANDLVVPDHHKRFLLPLLLIGGTATGIEPFLLEAVGLSTFPPSLRANTELCEAGQENYSTNTATFASHILQPHYPSQ